MGEKTTIAQRFVFLDRDGVINRERGDFTITIDQWEWAPYALEGIKLLTDAGFNIIVITNQSCIARGLQTEEGLAVLHDYMIENVRKAGGNILKIYHCPHVNEDNCRCRKPEPGMLLRAAEDFCINLSGTFFIVDSPRDIEAGRRAGTRTICVDSIKNTELQMKDVPSTVQPDFIAHNLLDAARIVIRESLP